MNDEAIDVEALLVELGGTCGPVQRQGIEVEWMAGCQARSFAPWVGALAASLDAAATPGALAPAAPLQVAVLNAELQGVGLAKAAHQGLPADWVTRLTLLDPHRRQVPPRHPGRRLTAIEPPA